MCIIASSTLYMMDIGVIKYKYRLFYFYLLLFCTATKDTFNLGSTCMCAYVYVYRQDTGTILGNRVPSPRYSLIRLSWMISFHFRSCQFLMFPF